MGSAFLHQSLTIPFGTQQKQANEEHVAMAVDKTVIHAVLLSFPIPSHLNPLLQLAGKLVAFCDAFVPSCEFVFTCIVSDHVATRAGSHVASNLNVRMVALPDGLPYNHPRSDFKDQLRACDNLRVRVEQLMPSLLRRGSPDLPPASCILSDVFVSWSYDVASRFGLPLFYFFTANATACCVMSYTRALLEQGVVPLKVHDSERITCPGAPSLLPSEFPPSMQSQDVSFYRFQFTLKIFKHLPDSAGLILNTCSELEPNAIETLASQCRVSTVGPLLLPIGDPYDHSVASSPTSSEQQQHQVSFWQSDDECLQWLDKKAPCSVVYISFGSLSTFTDISQMHELAMGLEDTEQPLLWVIRHDAVNGSIEDVMPPGFLDRTKDRCLIISWAPQLLVLEHPALGVFLSHCGWNSIFENMALRGLPMLCWPDIAEQKINARMVVDKWKLGLEFKRGKDGRVGRHEVERVVRALMTEGEERREKAKGGADLKRLVESAVMRNGSSFRNLQGLVTAMKGTRTVGP